MKKAFRIIFLLVLGYVLISIAGIFIEERLSEFEDGAELREFEQADILK